MFYFSSQKEAVDELMYGTGNLMITGGAGTGKSHITRNFIAKNTQDDIAVCASTGVASLHINGQTLHRFFGIPYHIYNPELQAKEAVHALTPEKLETIRNIKTLLIDELSMTRSDVFDYAEAFLRLARGSEEPWGGVRVVGVGDPYQLPPVVTDREKDAILHPWFFQSDAWQKTPFKILELTKIYRQKDDKTFAQVLNKIRRGMATDQDYALLNTRVGEPQPQSVILATVNKTVDLINHEELDKVPGPPTVYQAEMLNIVADYNISKAIPAPDVLSVKKGARVIMVTNHNGDDDFGSGEWVNGSAGALTDIRPDPETGQDRLIVKLDTGKTIEVCQYTWESSEKYYDDEKEIWGTRELGRATQYPLRLGWAITVHKSQGMSFDRLHFINERIFERGQMYVALSRATTLSGLTISEKINPKDVMVAPEVAAYFHDRLMVSRQNLLDSVQPGDKVLWIRTNVPDGYQRVLGEVVEQKGDKVKLQVFSKARDCFKFFDVPIDSIRLMPNNLQVHWERIAPHPAAIESPPPAPSRSMFGFRV